MGSVTEFFADLYGGSFHTVLVLDEKQNIVYATRGISDLLAAIGEQEAEVLLTPSVRGEMSYCLDRMKCRVVPSLLGDHPMEITILPYPYGEKVYLVVEAEMRPTPLADDEVRMLFRNSYSKLTAYLNEIYGITQKIGLHTPEGEDISRSVRRVLRMANHLYYMMDAAGKMHYRIPVDLNDFASTCVRSVLELAPTAELHYVPGETGLYANVMPENLEMVLVTIISNGLRFGNDRVLVYTHREGDRIYITVNDNGEGVEDLDRLFEMGYRTTDKYGVKGLGYSLFMAKKLLEMQGADLLYERKGGETFFHISAEAVDLPEGRMAEWRPEPMENTLSQLRIEISDFVKETDL